MIRSLLVLAMMMASAPAQAGLIMTEVTTNHIEPACVMVEAGGITGPGSGVTIQNKCNYPITINAIKTIHIWGLKPLPDSDVYLSNNRMTPPDQRFDFSKSGMNDVAMFRLTPKGGACDHHTIGTNNGNTTAKCQSITIAPNEDFMFFSGFTKFRVTGTPNLLILGREMAK